MCGDTAGLIHPLCGNGMAMAIHSAKLVSELVIQFFSGKLAGRADLEKQYISQWSAEFKTRLLTGRIVQSVLSSYGYHNDVVEKSATHPQSAAIPYSANAWQTLVGLIRLPRQLIVNSHNNY